MAFFVPTAESGQHAESIYQSIASHIGASIPEKRVSSVRWIHEGKEVSLKVGDPMPKAFCPQSKEVVMAIYDCGDVVKVCSPNRGVVHSDPVLASKRHVLDLGYFK